MSKLRVGQSKYALKKLAEPLGVPVRAINRTKEGFAMPLVHWFQKELKSGIGHILLEPRSLARGYFNTSGVRTMLEEQWQERPDNSGSLWILLMFELWHRNYLDPVRGGNSIVSKTSSSDPAGTLAAPSFRATQRRESLS
jgi:asparagine synthase (glutamine-hydrolysing)